MTTLARCAGLLALFAIPTATQAAALASADKVFLTKDAQGGTYELASAKLAVDKASDAAVKDYAQKLVTDHDRYNAALAKLAQDKGVKLPAGMEEADRKRLARLKRLSGPVFDKAYLAEAIRVNAEDTRDADKEKGATKDDGIKDFIEQFAAMDAEHERSAKELRAKVR